MCGIRLERQVAESIDNQQLRLGVVRQALLELAIGMRLGKAGPSTSRILPTPGGPSSRTASLLMMNRLPAISRTCALSIDGCALKSKPAGSRAKGKRTRPQLMSMRRWSRRAISRSQNSARCQRLAKLILPQMWCWRCYRSSMQAARRCAMPRRFSFSRRASSPPSEHRCPVSNRATIGLPPTGDRPRSIGLISAQAGMAFRDWAGLASTPVCSMPASHRELSGLGPYRKGGRSEVNTKPPTRLHSKVLPSTRQRRTARDGNMADVRVTCTNGVHR